MERVTSATRTGFNAFSLSSPLSLQAAKLKRRTNDNKQNRLVLSLFFKGNSSLTGNMYAVGLILALYVYGKKCVIAYK